MRTNAGFRADAALVGPRSIAPGRVIWRQGLTSVQSVRRHSGIRTRRWGGCAAARTLRRPSLPPGPLGRRRSPSSESAVRRSSGVATSARVSQEARGFDFMAPSDARPVLLVHARTASAVESARGASRRRMANWHKTNIVGRQGRQCDHRTREGAAAECPPGRGRRLADCRTTPSPGLSPRPPGLVRRNAVSRIASAAWKPTDIAHLRRAGAFRASMAAGILAAAESLCARYWAGSRCSGGRCSPPLLSAMTNTRFRSRPLVRAV